MNLPKHVQILVFVAMVIVLAGFSYIAVLNLDLLDKPNYVLGVLNSLKLNSNTDQASKQLLAQYELNPNHTQPPSDQTPSRNAIVAYVIDAEDVVIGGKHYSGLVITMAMPEDVKNGSVTYLTREMTEHYAAQVILDCIRDKHAPLTIMVLPL